MTKENAENSMTEHGAAVSDRYRKKIHKSSQYTYVYRNGTAHANRDLVLYVIKNESDTNRYGISVSKKVGNSVVRHRLARLLRESFRLNESRLKTGYDIVVVARANAKGKDYSDISRSFMHLANIHGLINNG